MYNLPGEAHTGVTLAIDIVEQKELLFATARMHSLQLGPTTPLSIVLASPYEYLESARNPSPILPGSRLSARMALLQAKAADQSAASRTSVPLRASSCTTRSRWAGQVLIEYQRAPRTKGPCHSGSTTPLATPIWPPPPST